MTLMFLRIGILYAVLTSVQASTVELYNGNDQLEFDCNVDLRQPFSCYCLAPGLWRVYSSCSQYNSIGLEAKTCFIPTEQVKRVERMGLMGSGLTIVGSSGDSRQFRWEAIRLLLGDKLLVQHPTTVSDGRTTLCLSNVQRQDYCLYEPPKDFISVVSVEEGCSAGALQIAPKECYPVTTGERACPDSQGPDLKRLKRMFMPFALNVTPFADNSSHAEEDEDSWSDPGLNEPNVAILTEIWNYLDRQADILLGLRDAEYEYNYITPIFQVMQLSLNVMKQTCPAHYVPPGFLDLAVNSFIQLLRKRKFFTEYGYDFEGVERIKVALMACADNLTAFPFRMFQNDTCNSTVVPVGGYSLYGEFSELDITQNYTSWSYDPIIDTAWKVFYNAQQYCFSFFDPIYNDHHRYGTMIETLFLNSVYKIWTTGETRSDMYGGFFGDLRELTNKVAYCAATSSLDTQYPWDIPRPGPEDVAARRKRSLEPENAKYTDLDAAVCVTGNKCTDFNFKRR